MSLSDALLLEPYRDPREVWIALRADGQKGSGTMADPYDGSRRDHPAFSITSLTKGGAENRIATAVTSSNHPFLPGDMVTVVGVATGIPENRCYTGTFPVLYVDTSSFTYQMLWAPTSTLAPGTSISCFREREQFDAVLRALPANSVIHVGPGVFESKGTAPAGIQNWAPKSGQRIVGSGRGVTILKLVNASWPELHYVLIGDVDYRSFIEDFEVSDLTFDCNIAGQPEHPVSCAAISVVGRHLRLHRLHAINFSSQTSYIEIENFVFAVAAPHPDAGPGKEGVNNVIEDCIAEQPGLNRGNNSSVFMLATGEHPTNGIMVWHRACAIRQCWYDGLSIPNTAPTGDMWVGRFSSHRISVKQIERDPADPYGKTAILTWRGPHYRKPGQWVRVVTPSDPPKDGTAPYFGYFEIMVDSITAPNVLKYQMASAPDVALVQDTYRLPETGKEDNYPACMRDTVFLGVGDVGFSTDGGSEAEFGMLGAQGAYISWIGFRSDSTLGRGFGANQPSVEILMGTTRQDPDGLSTTFVDNPAGDLTTVYSRGPLLFGAAGPGSLGAITLQTPFLYNPAEGNLLLEIRNHEPVPPPYREGLIAGVLDAWNLEGDSVARVYALDVNAETGIADTVGLTTYFVVARVPEPSALGLLGLVGGLWGLHWLHKNRGSTQP